VPGTAVASPARALDLAQAMTASARILYGTPNSGHTHRVECLLQLLGLDYQFSAAPADRRRSPEFLALNPLGQIPVLDDGGVVLADSGAILVYLARRYAPGSAWLPDEPVAAARVQRWLAIAAGELKFGPAAARRIARFGGTGDRAEAHALAARLFQFMEDQLAARAFLAADHPTLADLACYAYTARAPEGGIALDAYPHIRAWLGRVEAIPGLPPMPTTPPPAR
jgi:glutathione S-transferase